MLKKNEEYLASIEELGCNGEGIARIDGCAVFTPYAIRGEQVKLKILKAKNGYAFAKAEEIVKPSPYRVTPECPVYKKCGGCNVQHIDYSEQLIWKSEMVADCLRKIADIEIDVPKTIASVPNFRYRNKIQLPTRHTKNGNEIGFFRENSHDIISVEDCLIQRKWAKDIIEVFKNYLSLSNDSCFDEQTLKGNLKHVVAREVGDKLIIVAVITQKSLKKQELLIKLLEEKFDSFSLFININLLNNNVIFGKDFKLIYGTEKTVILEGGISMPMGPESFMQVNDYIRNKIYDDVCRLVGENSAVIDAYSGAGYLTARLAKHAKIAYGIECVQEAVDCADKLKEDNGLADKITNICGLCEDVLPDLIDKVSKLVQGVVVVLDPPRKGCDNAVLQSILKSKPDKIVYVSCNPSTLARDVGILTGTLKYEGAELKKTKSNNGLYTFSYVQPYDMFSHTKHVESVVCLKRQIQQ